MTYLTSSSSLVGLVDRKPATCWEVMVRTGFESRWGWISVAVRMVYLAMLSLWLACRMIKWTDTTSTRLASNNGHGCYITWGNDCKHFKLSHKARMACFCCRGWQYNKCNSLARRQKGLTGYCFKYIDRPFCLRTDELYLPFELFRTNANHVRLSQGSSKMITVKDLTVFMVVFHWKSPGDVILYCQ